MKLILVVLGMVFVGDVVMGVLVGLVVMVL